MEAVVSWHCWFQVRLASKMYKKICDLVEGDGHPDYPKILDGSLSLESVDALFETIAHLELQKVNSFTLSTASKSTWNLNSANTSRLRLNFLLKNTPWSLQHYMAVKMDSPILFAGT